MKVKLNEDKTEALVLGKPSVLAGVSIDAIDVAGCQIALSSSVKSLRVTIDPILSIKQHINNVCKACYYEIRLISTIRKFLHLKSATTIASCFVLFRLDYCNVLLSGLPRERINTVLPVWC